MRLKAYFMIAAMMMSSLSFAQSSGLISGSSSGIRQPEPQKKMISGKPVRERRMPAGESYISVAQAISLGMQLDSLGTSSLNYVVEGYVVNAGTFSVAHGNQNWYMSDDPENSSGQEFQAYYCTAYDNDVMQKVLDGDKVQLYGALYKYYDRTKGRYVIEISRGTAQFVSKVSGDHSVNTQLETISVAEALSIGADVAIGNMTERQYLITGYVSSMAGRTTDFSQYGNQTFWIADDSLSTASSNADGAFYIYRGVARDENDSLVEVHAGDRVQVKTAIKNYQGILETETGAFVTILPKEEPQPQPQPAESTIRVQLDPSCISQYGWSTVNLYAWVTDDAGEVINPALLGTWPGTEVGRDSETGWFDYTFYRNNIGGHLNIIWNYLGSQQTYDITGVEQDACFAIVGHSGLYDYAYVDCPTEPYVPTPVVNDTIELNFTSTMSMTYYSEGDWYFYANEPNQVAAVDVYGNSESPVGEYDNSVFYHYYTKVAIPDSTGDMRLYETLSGNATVYERNDTIFLEAVLQCEDNKVFIIRMFHDMYDPYRSEATIPLVAQFPSYTWSEENGNVYIFASNGGQQINLSINTNGSSLLPGVYNISGSDTIQHVWASNGEDQNSPGYYYYSFVNSFDSIGNWADPFWFFVNGTVTINSDRSVHVEAFNTHGQSIVCDIAAPEPERISIARALEIGASLQSGYQTFGRYSITGYVSAMAGNSTDFSQYGNQTFWIAADPYSTAASNADSAFYIYRGVPTQEVHLGDRVQVVTAIKNYNNIYIETESYAPVTVFATVEPFDFDMTANISSISDWAIIDATFNEAESIIDGGNLDTYQYDITGGIPGVAYAYALPEVTYTVKNSSDKLKAFQIGVSYNIGVNGYYQFGGKNGVLTVKNTSSGDLIRMTVAAKGSSAANFYDANGEYPKNAWAVTEDLVLPARDASSPDADQNGYIWRILEYRSLGGDVEIKEFAAGYRIRHISLIRDDAGGDSVPDLNNLTVAQAVEYGSTLAINTLADTAVVTGWVVAADAFDPAFDNQTFYIVDDLSNPYPQLVAYLSVPTKDGEYYPVIAGDQVQIKGRIEHYVSGTKNHIELMRPTVTFLYEEEGVRNIGSIITTDVAGALEQVTEMPTGKRTKQVYDVIGYVTALVEDDYDKYGNQSYWIADSPKGATSNAEGALYVYRAVCDRPLIVGDRISVRTHIHHVELADSTSRYQTTKNAIATYLGHAEEEYTVNVKFFAPQYAPDSVELIGSFCNWSNGALMSYDEYTGAWTASVRARGTDEFKFRQYGTWNNEPQHHYSDTTWYNFGNFMFQDYWYDGEEGVDSIKVVYFDLSDPTYYRWSIPNIPTEEPLCYYILDMKDTYGDGWNGCAIRFEDGVHHDRYTLSAGAHDRVQVPYYGRQTRIYWHRGSYPGEVNFSLVAPNGMGLYHFASGQSIADGQLLFELQTSPCEMGYNPYNVQNIQGTLAEDKSLAINWDVIPEAAYYTITIIGPNNSPIVSNGQVDEAYYNTTKLSLNGQYTIMISAHDVEGMQIGEGIAVVPVVLPIISQATVNILIPADCGMDVSNGVYLYWSVENDTYHIDPLTPMGGHVYSCTIAPNSPSYYYEVLNAPDWNDSIHYSSLYVSSKEVTCAEIAYSSDQWHDMLSYEACDYTDHDYRVSNLQAESGYGYVHFTWNAPTQAQYYLLTIYEDSLGYQLTTLHADNAMEYHWNVPDDYDGLNVRWSIRPYAGYTYPTVYADQAITLHKALVRYEEGGVSSNDSITMNLWWRFSNSEAVQYLVEIETYGAIIKSEIVSDTTYSYTGIFPAYHYCYVTALNSDGQALTSRVNLGHQYLRNVVEPISNLTGNADGHHLLYTWNSITEYVYVQIFQAMGNEQYEMIYAGTTSLDSLAYDVAEDGLYILQISSIIQYGTDSYYHIPNYTHVSAQAFTNAMYAVTLQATEGGYVFPQGMSGNYPEGYELIVDAYANEDYRFIGWSDGVQISHRLITVTSDITLTAMFEAIPKYHLTIHATEGGLIYAYDMDYSDSIFNGYIREDVNIYAYASALEGYTFAGWSDGVTTSERYIVLSSDSVITAIFRPNCRLTLPYTTGGYVSCNGDYLKVNYDSISSVYTFPYGSEVHLEAIPHSGYRFIGWSDSVSTIQRTFTIESDMTFRPVFEQIVDPLRIFSVTIGVTGDGYGYITPHDVAYYEGTSIEVGAIPYEGSEFVMWSDGVQDNPRTILVDTTIILSARFAALQQSLTVRVSQTGGGSVNAVSGFYPYGTEVQAIATPDAGYRFAGWSDGSMDMNRIIYMNADIVLTAYFEKIPVYPISIEAQQGGKISVNGGEWIAAYTDSLMEYSTITLSAQADGYYRFAGWSDGVMSVNRTITVSQPINLTANFVRLPIFTLTISSENGGKIMATGMQEAGMSYIHDYDQSELVTIQAIADTGFVFMGWSDGNTEAIRSFYLTEDISLSASFSRVASLVVLVSGNGSVEVEGAYISRTDNLYQVAEGIELHLTAIPDSTYRFTGWSDGVTTVQRTITVSGVQMLTANFEQAAPTISQYNVQITSAGNGEGTVTNVSGTYYEGDVLSVKASPAANSEFVMWSDSVTDNPRTIIVHSDLNIQAIFAIQRLTLTLLADTGGTVNDSLANGVYDYGTPVLATATADEHYHFIGWSDGVAVQRRWIYLDADSTITALFEPNQYLITFVNYNDSILSSEYWTYGTTPVCPVTPMKPEEGLNEYIFAGWDPEITIAVGEATYKALFTEQAFAFEVTFYDENDSIIVTQIVNRGEAAVLPEEPVKEGFYFIGWVVDQGDLTNVQCTIQARPSFKPNEEGIEDVQSGDVPCTKVLRDDQILIIRGGKTFTVHGTELR